MRFRNKFCNKITLLCMCMLCLLFTTSCMNLTALEKSYYIDRNNYIEATGVVEYILFDDEEQALYVRFSGLSEQFVENCFKIVGNNYSVIVENGAEDKLKIGETVAFVTAPKYFGDGYVIPIAGLTVGEDCILDFETGYANLLEWLYE